MLCTQTSGGLQYHKYLLYEYLDRRMQVSAQNQISLVDFHVIGKKICLHVHGVFPYLYIPYDGSEEPNCLKYQIAANIDKAINISFGQASSTAQHVYKITLVSGM
jgi:hypothetical protein